MISQEKFCLLSNDVETTSIWFNSLRDETGKKVLEYGLPKLLEIYSQHNIKSTFFFTGYFARKFPEAVRMIIPYGHEVGSHGKSHLPENAFDIMPYERQKRHLIESKNLLEDISGEEVISFRAPALRVNRDTAIALLESGYKIDSSIASQRFDFFLSFGSLKKIKWLYSPRLPYKTSKKSLHKRGNGPIVEIPLSALLTPYVSTTMRIFPRLTSIQGKLLDLENKFNGKPIVFNIHPNELIDESSEKREIQRRASNFFNYLLKDYIRSKLKIKNLGDPCVELYSELINYYKQNYNMITLKEYCKRKGML